MNNIKILLKKDINERIANIKNTKKDIVGVILNVFLTMFVIGVFVFAFSYFTQTYANIKIGYFTYKAERTYEILTIFYSLLIILLTIIGVTKLNKNLIDVGNLTLLSMPISPFQIFVSKLFGVFIDLSITSLLTSVSIFILLVIQGLISWYLIFISIIFAILIPILALGLASILTIPYYFIKKWLNKHVVIQLIVYILIMALVFILYSIFLRFVKGLMESGQISFFFNQDSVTQIANLCKFLIPANFFSSLLIGKSIILNILFIILSLVISAVICFYMSKSIFGLVQHNKIGSKDDLIVKKSPREKRKVTTTLMAKEYLNVLRTPNYAFNYFAIVLSLPLMVVITSSLLCSMMQELTFLNCDYEIVLCSISMFSIMLNSFCANNISRDGKFFNLLKTYPISTKKIIFSKILFCSITSFVSILITGVVILVTGLLSPLKVLAVVIICSILNFGVICLVTRKDLNTTKNKSGNENASAVNFLIFWGLLFSAALTVVSFVVSLYLQTRFNLLVSNLITSAVLLGLSIFVFVCSILYLLKNLDKKFKEIILWKTKLFP